MNYPFGVGSVLHADHVVAGVHRESEPEADLESSTGDVIDGEGVAGQHGPVPQWNLGDTRGDADVFGALGDA